MQDNLVSFLFLGATAFGLLLAFILRNRSARSVKFDGPIVTQNGQVDCRKQIVQAFENVRDRNVFAGTCADRFCHFSTRTECSNWVKELRPRHPYGYYY